jgi:hypothetical protein
MTSCNNRVSIPRLDVVLSNVNVVDPLSQTIIPDQRIWMSAGMIKSIGSADQLTDLANVIQIDGQGGFVTPGLIDMHTHIYDQAAPAIALSHGVIHMRVLNGMPQILAWREKLNKGELWGSTLSVSSPIITGNSDDVLRTYVETKADAYAAVDDAVAAGYDLIKIYNSLPADLHSAVIHRANELNIPIAQHGPHPPAGLPWSRLSGLQSFEHVEDIFQGPLAFKRDADKLDGVLIQLKALKVPIVTTLGIFEQLTNISAEKGAFLSTLPLNYTPATIRYIEKRGQVKRWLESPRETAEFNEKELEYLIDITRRMNDKGIPVLVGSDAGVLLFPHGIATHREMALLAKSGLSNFDIISAATSSPAAALGLSSELGQLKQGARADFIYTQSNPVADLSVLKKPNAVIRQGQWYADNVLRERRDKAIRNRNFFKVLWLLLSNY